jgi:hypothetical protein
MSGARTSARSAAAENARPSGGGPCPKKHLVSRIEACDREIRSLNLSQVRHVLAGAPPEIATLLGEVFVWDAFLAVARLHPMPIVNKASR